MVQRPRYLSIPSGSRCLNNRLIPGFRREPRLGGLRAPKVTRHRVFNLTEPKQSLDSDIIDMSVTYYSKTFRQLEP